MDPRAALKTVWEFVKLAGEAARWLGRLRRAKRPPDPKLDETDPIPLTWRDVEHQRNLAASSVAAAKAASIKPGRSRYD